MLLDHRCSQTIYWYQRQFFKNVCVAGMAVRLNMSPASLCSHVHKSTYNDCKPEKTHRPEKSTAAHLRPHLQLPQTSRWRPSQPWCTSSTTTSSIVDVALTLPLQNKRSVCWWLPVKVSYWCKKASSAGLHCASFEKWKKKKKKKEALEQVVSFEPHKARRENNT